MMTEEEQHLWHTDGLLHLKGVLSPDQVAFFNEELDRIRALPGYEPDNDPTLPMGHYSWFDHAKDLDPDGFMDRRDLLSYHQAFVDLIDAQPVFDYVLEIMGPNMLLSMTQAIVRRPSDKFPGYTHTDGGESLRMIRPTENCPPIAMKAMYLLTDVTEENTGNLTVYPGSHYRQIPDDKIRTMTPYSTGATQLMGNAGDVYLFPHALWHGPARNESDHSRRVLLYNYCQLWVRSYDHHDVPSLKQQVTPRQRRLLGDLGYDFRPGSYFYVPNDQEAVMQQG